MPPEPRAGPAAPERPLSEDLRRSAVRGVFWSGLQQASDRGLRMLVFSILATLVEPDVIGVVALAMVFVDGLGLLLNQGLTAALVQREQLTDSHRNSALLVHLTTALVLVAVVYLGGGALAGRFGNPTLEALLRWLSLGFVFTALSGVQDANLRRELRFKALAVRTLVSRIVGAIVGVALALRGYGAWSLVAMHLVNQGVAVVVLWLASSWRPALRFSWTSYRELLAFGLRILGVDALATARTRGDDLLVGSLLGETTLGFYALAKTLTGGVFALVDGTITPVAWVTLTRLQSSREKLGRALEEGAQLTAAIVLPAGAGLLVTAPMLVGLLFGMRWLPTLPVIAGLVTSRMLAGFMGHNRMALNAIGEVNTNLGLSCLAAVLTLTGIAAGSVWGLAGVAVGLVVAAAVQLPVDLLCSFRLLPIEPRSFLLRLAAPSLLTLAMSVSLLLIRPTLGDGWMGLALLISMGAAIYGVAAMIAAPEIAERVRANLLSGMQRHG
jgi:PST family polysaccharide transporter